MQLNLEIRCVVIGFGDFGSRAYWNLKHVMDQFNQGGQLAVKWHGVVESSERRRAEIKDSLMADDVPIYATLEEALDRLPDRNVRLFVHDLADNAGRLGRAERILELPNSFVLAEKPLFIARQQFPRAVRLAHERPRFTVDFPENTKAVSRAAFSLMRDLLVHEITCFQINSLGEEKLLSPGTRPGVAGGSMLDKAPHPHAWCYQALSPVEAVEIVAAEAVDLMPYRLNTTGIYMDVHAGAKTTSRLHAADAEGQSHLRYGSARQPDQLVDVRIISGWRGVRADIQQYVSGLSLPASLMLDEPKQGKLGSFANQELRLKIIHGELRGQPVTLVVSTLPREEQGIPPQAWLARQAVARYRFPGEGQPVTDGAAGPIQWERMATDGQPESLDALYENALLATAGMAEPFLSASEAVEIHRLVITCRETAHDQLPAAA